MGTSGDSNVLQGLQSAMPLESRIDPKHPAFGVHALLSFCGVGVFRTAEDQRTAPQGGGSVTEGERPTRERSEWSGQRR